MIGVLCLDGLDWNLFEERGLAAALPDDAECQRLTNDLPGPIDRQGTDDTYNLYTPYVWSAMFSGDPDVPVHGWHTLKSWHSLTENQTFLWDRVPGTSVNNLRVAGKPLHINSVLPEGWTPANQDLRHIKDTSQTLRNHWNKAVEERPAPLFIMWFRMADGFGHKCLKKKIPLATWYDWIRDDFFPSVEWPDRWVIMSDHGFQNDTENGPTESGSHSSRLNHRPDGVLAHNFIDRGNDAERSHDAQFRSMTDFVESWTWYVLDAVNQQNMEAMGYVDGP